jgi:hypothetical protein
MRACDDQLLQQQNKQSGCKQVEVQANVYLVTVLGQNEQMPMLSKGGQR